MSLCSVPRQPLSSMVYGTNALITKPAHSFAPMITVVILNRYGYESMKSSIEAGDLDGLPQDQLAGLQAAMFYIMCLAPVLVGLVQLFIWSFYTIRNSHTTIVKHIDT